MTAAPTDTGSGVLTIDLAAIAANWRLLQAKVRPADCAAVVKADAYGLGAAMVAPALLRAGCRIFFVATLDEAIALRTVLDAAKGGRSEAAGEDGEGAVIYVLNGAPAGTAALFTAHRLRPVLNSLGEIQGFAAHAREIGRTLPVALHVDTGMSRLGLPEDELNELADDYRRLTGLRLMAVLSHLACADTPANPMNERQLWAFRAALQRLPPAAASLANSAGIFLGPAYHGGLVRPGIALYGGAPTAGSDNPMQGVVRLQAPILQVRTIDAGTSVGYGATHVAARRQRIATVAAGYADGLLRSLSNRGSARLGQQAVPLIGRVSMDLTTFDVTDCPKAAACPGAMIELLGPGHPIDAAAADAGTISYEILTALGRRYRRVYRPDEA
jgi:alanine racemase